MKERARTAIGLCRELAAFSEEEGRITRTFLSAPMKDVHRVLSARMRGAGMDVSVDAVGNLHGVQTARSDAPRLVIGSHLDTVPNAGAFDGVLGVVLGILLAESLQGQHPHLAIEVLGFSEEEGVRFGIPFLGSRAVVGSLDDAVLDLRDREGCSVREAIKRFGLDYSDLPHARLSRKVIGYLEFHIEQGPVLESLGSPLGIVEGIAGQSRLELVFEGKANHAGTTPMSLRRDALVGAAEWILEVEKTGRDLEGLVATVGVIDNEPNASNAIPGQVSASLDIRHEVDAVRCRSVERSLAAARAIAVRRQLGLRCHQQLDQPAVRMDKNLTAKLAVASQSVGCSVHRMISGAGHDAMIMAPHLPSAMLFLRSPGGLSHCPEESVVEDDVAWALSVGARFFRDLEAAHA